MTPARRFAPGAALIHYGDGDWGGTLQPANRAMRTRIVGSWTVAPAFDTFGALAEVCRRAGKAGRAPRVHGLLVRIRRDFAALMMPDGVVAGFLVVPCFGPYDDGGDRVETSFMMEGLLAARRYFDRNGPGEDVIRSAITGLWRGVEWDCYRKSSDGPVQYWHWPPDHGFYIRHPLIGWNETMNERPFPIARST